MVRRLNAAIEEAYRWPRYITTQLEMYRGWLGKGNHAALLVALATLLALALRLYKLADQSIWWDEGWTVWLGRRDWAWIALRTAADEHPPLHYWLVRGWDMIAGELAFAVRFSSVLAGTLAVPLVYRLGRLAANKQVGVLAAVFLAVARFHIWWSQDIKMYALAVALCIASLYLVLRIVRGGSLWLFVAYVAVTAAAIYTHYLALLVALSENLLVLIVLLMPMQKPAGRAPIPGNMGGVGAASAGMGGVGAASAEFAAERARGEKPRCQKPAGRAPMPGNVGGVGAASAGMGGVGAASAEFAAERARGEKPRCQKPAGRAPTPGNVGGVGAASAEFAAERARGEKRRLLLGWVAAQLALVALGLPWVYLTSQHTIAWVAPPPLSFALFLRLYATVLSLGITTHVERYTLPMLGFLLVAALGLLPLWRGRREQRQGSLLLWLCLAVPPLLIYLLSLFKVTSFYAAKVEARYLLILLPAFLLVLAWGVDVLQRRWPLLAAAALAFVLGGLLAPLPGYFAERHLRDDYQSLVGIVQAYAQPGDAILLHTDESWPIFAYHERRELPWYGVPYRGHLDTGAVDALLAPIAARHPAVWLVVIPDALARDPQGLVEKWLAAHYRREANVPLGDKRLVLYSRDSRSLHTVPPQNLTISHPLAIALPGDLTLLGFDLPVRKFWTGQAVRLALYWQGPAAAEEPRLSIALLDARGQPVHQARRPLKPGYPRREWQPDQVVRGEYALPIPSTVPGGRYSLALRLEDGDPWLRLAAVRVVQRQGGPLPGSIAHPRRENLANQVLFLGYDLRPVTGGRPAGPPPAGLPLIMRPGEALEVTLYWQAQEPLEHSYKVFVHFLGEATGNRLWGQKDSIPGQGAYPTTGWAVGEVVTDQYTVTLLADAPPGDYIIEIGLYDGTTGERLPVLDDAGNFKDDRIILETVRAIAR
jgi:4-amino-4-deoxy-L-arabinose transferase-like glycosyltransferase